MRRPGSASRPRRCAVGRPSLDPAPSTRRSSQRRGNRPPDKESEQVSRRYRNCLVKRVPVLDILVSVHPYAGAPGLGRGRWRTVANAHGCCIGCGAATRTLQKRVDRRPWTYASVCHRPRRNWARRVRRDDAVCRPSSEPTTPRQRMTSPPRGPGRARSRLAAPASTFRWPLPGDVVGCHASGPSSSQFYAVWDLAKLVVFSPTIASSDGYGAVKMAVGCGWVPGWRSGLAPEPRREQTAFVGPG